MKINFTPNTQTFSQNNVFLQKTPPQETTLKSLEGSNKNNYDGYSQTLVIRFFQKAWVFFQILVSNIFCYTPNLMYQNVEKTLTDGSQIITYKTHASTEKIRVKVHKDISWVLLDIINRFGYSTGFFSSTMILDWKWKTPFYKAFLSDIKSKTDLLAIPVKNWTNARNLYKIGFRFNSENPKKYDGNENKKKVMTFSPDSNIHPNEKEKTKGYDDLLNTITGLVNTVEDKKHSEIQAIGKLVKEITKENLDVTDIESIKKTWNKSKDQLGEFTFDINLMIEASLLLKPFKNFLHDSPYPYTYTYSTKYKLDFWPRTMELDLS